MQSGAWGAHMAPLLVFGIRGLVLFSFFFASFLRVSAHVYVCLLAECSWRGL